MYSNILISRCILLNSLVLIPWLQLCHSDVFRTRCNDVQDALAAEKLLRSLISRFLCGSCQQCILTDVPTQHTIIFILCFHVISKVTNTENINSFFPPTWSVTPQFFITLRFTLLAIPYSNFRNSEIGSILGKHVHNS